MIRNVLFDLGQVMLHLRYERAVQAAAPLCARRAGAGTRGFFGSLSGDPVFAGFERGDIAPAAFYAHIRSALGFSADFDAFVRIWRDIFEPNAPMLEFGRALTRELNVYFASNSNVLHVPYVYEAFPALAFHKDHAVSCYLHELKPQRAFFEKALARFGVEADACLFVDDSAANVAGAEACGIRSVLYTEPAATIAAVRDALG
ncbi:MAG: HAD family phosphatase [Kiritimatiellae bacterium]|nr:HAD family phosphatase [Kiritimatiellia bacterium]